MTPVVDFSWVGSVYIDVEQCQDIFLVAFEVGQRDGLVAVECHALKVFAE